MKRFIPVLMVVAAVILVAGCSVPKTYYWTQASSGFCAEVMTADRDLQNALTSTGFYKEGTCSANGYGSAHYCSIASMTGSISYTINYYWSSATPASDVQSFCTALNGTYH